MKTNTADSRRSLLPSLASIALAAALHIVPAATATAGSVTVAYDPGNLNVTTALTGYGTTGDLMAGMYVTAFFMDGTSEQTIWQSLGYPAGEAVGTGWYLAESGDTFGSAWALSNITGQGIYRVLIDAGHGNTVFDTRAIGDVAGTPGSARGSDFTVAGGLGALEIVATYRDEVALDGSPPVGDLFRFLDIAFTNPGGFPSGGTDLMFITDTDNILFAGDIRPALDKEIVLGPDVDLDGNIDVVVEVGQYFPTHFQFSLFYNNPGGPPVLVVDTVPAEWDTTLVDDDAGRATSRAANKKTNGKSATKISWTPDPPGGEITVDAVTRMRPNSKFAPTSCGTLWLNDGAEAYEVDIPTGDPLVDQDGYWLPPIFESNMLCLAALEDVNGDGVIIRDGSGDEDGDGLSDLHEACELFSDPCNPGDPFATIDLDALYTEPHDRFDNGARGFVDYYSTPTVYYSGVPFMVKIDGANTVSSTLGGMEAFHIPAGGGSYSTVWMLGVGTWLAPPMGHGPGYCDDPSHFWFELHYTDGTSMNAFPTDHITGLPQWADILNGTGGVEVFSASPIGYVHLYRIYANASKELDFVVMNDNHPIGDYTMLAMTLQR